MYQLYAALTDFMLADPEAAAGSLPRLPVLERLLSKAERAPVDRDWRRWALGLAGLAAPPGDLPLGRTLAAGAGYAHDDACSWFVATPLRLVAGLASVHFDPAGPVEVAADEAAALAQRLARQWNDPTVTLVWTGEALLLRLAARIHVRTADPATLSGFSLGSAAPSGADAPRLERLQSELQMWLHGQALRGVDGRVVNALWLWGAGRAQPTGTPRWPVLAGDDAFLRAMAAGTVPTSERMLDSWSVAALARDGLAFAAADERWFAPLEARLYDGELAAAHLHLAGGVYTLRASDRVRVWRRLRPWWEWLG